MVERLFACALVACLLTIGIATAAQSLSYGKAKRAVQAKADAFAGARTKVTAMYKLGATRYSATAEWKRENPTGCTDCGYDPVSGQFFDTPTTESCSVGLQATLKPSGRVVVRTENSLCL